MHLRRIACLLLGAWLAGSIVVGWLATANFTAADRVLKSPPAEIRAAAAPLDPNRARMILRYLVAVENSMYFLDWELVEFALLAVLAAALAGDRQTRWLFTVPAAGILIVAFQHFRVTPEIVWLGQAMVRGIAANEQRDEFAAMHRMYGILEVLKLLLGFALAVWLVVMKSRRRSRRSSAEDASDGTFDRRYAT